MKPLRTVIDGVTFVIGLLIFWFALGAGLNLFIGVGGFALSALFVAVFWLVDDSPLCARADKPRECEYAEEELREGWHLPEVRREMARPGRD